MTGTTTRALRIAFMMATVAGALGAVCFAWLPVSTALSHFVIEDMGYYLTTARNIVGGKGVTLDGENPTNGFHPLWLVILCLLQALFGSHQETMFHVALSVSALLFVLTGWLLCQQIRADAGAWLVAPFAGLFFFNYRLVSIPLGGLETAVSGMTVVIVARFVSRWADSLNLKRAAILGGLLGLAYLARMDALLLGAIVLSWLAYRSFRMRSWQHFGLVVVLRWRVARVARAVVHLQLECRAWMAASQR